MADTDLRAAIAEWDRQYVEAPSHVGAELAKARKELRSAEYGLQRDLAVCKGRPSRHTETMAAEAERLRARADELDRLQSVRDVWWDQTEDVRSRAAIAREELAARHPDVDRAQLFTPAPEELEAERMSERQRRDRTGWSVEAVAFELPRRRPAPMGSSWLALQEVRTPWRST